MQCTKHLRILPQVAARVLTRKIHPFRRQTDSGGGRSLQKLGDKLKINQNTSTKVSVTDVNVNQNPTKEPAWNQKMSKKRQRTSPEEKANKLQQRTKQTKMDYWLNLPIATDNRYDLLDEEGNSAQETPSETSEPLVKSVTQSKPPPVFVAGVGDINPLYKLLDEIATNNYTLRVLNQSEVKIQAKTLEVYDTIVVALRSKRTEFHSYQKKVDKPFKVVLRNLHNTSDLELLKTQIEEYGHSVINIHNIRHRINKTPLPMFYVNLKNNLNNKEIYKIEYLLNTKIYFEPPNKKREIPQCMRCQRYGHTKNFCSRQPRCVKCAGLHLTADCTRKNKSQNVRCVLCEGNHPANYRGCQVYKELQRTNHPAPRKKEIPLKSSQSLQTTPAREQIKTTKNGTTYAQAINNETQQNTAQPSTAQPAQQANDINELKVMIKGLIEQMSTMLNLLTTLVTKKALNG